MVATLNFYNKDRQRKRFVFARLGPSGYYRPGLDPGRFE